jgi:hypothetical protein
MIRDLMLFIKYPYTAGIIATLWLGTASIIAIDGDLPVVDMIIIAMVATVIIAFIGFRGKQEM